MAQDHDVFPSQGQGKRNATVTLPLGFREVAVPERYRGHPLIRGKLFFTLPTPLLDAIVRELGDATFDPALLDLEYALSDVCRDHTHCVGFWAGQPIQYWLLRWLPLPEVSNETAASWGKNPVQMQRILRRFEKFSRWNRN
jgi:hypothetical protein